MDNREAFDEIAESWYRVRHWTRFRRELEEMAGRWRGGKLLNVGCGHGADFLPFKGKFDLYGVDFSVEMIRLSRRYSQKFAFEANLAVADARCLPFATNGFDWSIAVATYHHIRGADARLQAFAELRRVLKPGGEAFITVWNRSQPRFWFRGREVDVPWRLKGGTVYRYYYLFSYSELEEALKKAGFAVLRIFPEASYRGPFKVFSQNICALVKK